MCENFQSQRLFWVGDNFERNLHLIRFNLRDCLLGQWTTNFSFLSRLGKLNKLLRIKKYFENKFWAKLNYFFHFLTTFKLYLFSTIQPILPFSNSNLQREKFNFASCLMRMMANHVTKTSNVHVPVAIDKWCFCVVAFYSPTSVSLTLFLSPLYSMSISHPSSWQANEREHFFIMEKYVYGLSLSPPLSYIHL